jgi:hypothetical protein
MDKQTFLELIFGSVEFSTDERRKYGVYNDYQAAFMHFQTQVDIVAVGAVDHIMSLPDPAEREARLKSLKEAISTALDPAAKTDDPYGYRKILNKIIDYYS